MSVTGAVLQTPSWLTEWVSESVVLCEQIFRTLTLQKSRARRLNFERSFASLHLSCVTCQVSHLLVFGGGGVLRLFRQYPNQSRFILRIASLSLLLWHDMTVMKPHQYEDPFGPLFTVVVGTIWTDIVTNTKSTVFFYTSLLWSTWCFYR